MLIAAASNFGYLVSMAKETSDPSPMVKRLLVGLTYGQGWHDQCMRRLVGVHDKLL